ncbi:MAG: hypothetical protein WCY05_05495 [Candidatus Omnitrophota bacterium]
MDFHFVDNCGRLLRDDDKYADIQLSGGDFRDIAAAYAAAYIDKLSPEDRAHLAAIYERFTQGDLFGAPIRLRVYKNLYAAANKRPENIPE